MYVHLDYVVYRLLWRWPERNCVPVHRKRKRSHLVVAVCPRAIPTAAPPPNLPQAPVAQPTQNTSGTGSNHCNQKLNQWDVQRMKNSLEEWRYWEERRVRMGLKKLGDVKSSNCQKVWSESIYLWESYAWQGAGIRTPLWWGTATPSSFSR